MEIDPFTTNLDCHFHSSCPFLARHVITRFVRGISDSKIALVTKNIDQVSQQNLIVSPLPLRLGSGLRELEAA